MKAAYSNPNVLSVCTEESKLRLFRDLSERLDTCKKGLCDYLDTRREENSQDFTLFEMTRC
jgi:hypothetical protein